MKRFLSILLCAILVASLTVASAEEAVTLKIWCPEGTEPAFYAQLAEEYQATHPNVSVEFEAVNNTDTATKIVLDGPAGMGPDIFIAPHDTLGSLVTGGHILANPNADRVKAEFIDSAVKAATYQGTVYATPYGVETFALFYNKDLMPEAPKTWDDVIAFCKGFNDPASNKYGIVWKAADGYYDIMFLMGYGAQLFGPNGDDPMDSQIFTQPSIDGMKYLQSLRSQILDVNAADLTDDFCKAAFVEGNAAMYITGSWSINDFIEQGLNFGIATLPALPGQENPAPSFMGVRLLCVSAYSNHPQEAQDFIDFVTTKDAATRQYAADSHIPCRTDVTVEDPYVNGIIAQVQYAIPMPSIPEMGQYWISVGSAYSLIWDGDGTNIESELEAADIAVKNAGGNQ